MWTSRKGWRSVTVKTASLLCYSWSLWTVGSNGSPNHPQWWHNWHHHTLIILNHLQIQDLDSFIHSLTPGLDQSFHTSTILLLWDGKIYFIQISLKKKKLQPEVSKASVRHKLCWQHGCRRIIPWRLNTVLVWKVRLFKINFLHISGSIKSDVRTTWTHICSLTYFLWHKTRQRMETCRCLTVQI